MEFKVHKALLESTSEVLATDLNGDFGETYKFLGTDITTLVRFIEWAYTDAYPEAIDPPIDSNDNYETDADTAVFDAEALEERLEAAQAAEADRVLAHINLYIFAERYEIPRLKQAAYLRLCAQCADIGTPETYRTWPDIVDIVDLALSTLSADDKLLTWLAGCVAYRFQELLEEDGFLDILQRFPDFTIEVIKKMRPVQTPPWPCHRVSLLSGPVYVNGVSPGQSLRG